METDGTERGEPEHGMDAAEMIHALGMFANQCRAAAAGERILVDFASLERLLVNVTVRLLELELASSRPASGSPQGFDAHGLVRNFLSRLPFPDALPAPEIIVEEDGELCFDWDLARDASVSASLSSDGVIAWSALIGDYKGHGRFTLPTFAEDFNKAMRRLAKWEAASGSPQPEEQKK